MRHLVYFILPSISGRYKLTPTTDRYFCELSYIVETSLAESFSSGMSASATVSFAGCRLYGVYIYLYFGSGMEG